MYSLYRAGEVGRSDASGSSLSQTLMSAMTLVSMQRMRATIIMMKERILAVSLNLMECTKSVDDSQRKRGPPSEDMREQDNPILIPQNIVGVSRSTQRCDRSG